LIKKLNIDKREVAAEILEVQIAAYSVEAEIIGYFDLPPLQNTVEMLQKSGETFYGYFAGDRLGGVISFKAENGVIDIHRLFVHPDHFKKGIAQCLMDFVTDGVSELTVSTASKNTPAINFYKKNGFYKLNDVRVDEQLSLSFFRKHGDGS
jgi:ribosomal protein S18 acetylase RimI-like enzyme